MSLTKLYHTQKRIRRSNLCFDKGVAEIGGVELIAPLWLVQEERPKLIEGEKVYGRIREGLIVIPANYGSINPSSVPIRALVQKGLPLTNPKQAVQANKSGIWYAPDTKTYAEAIFNALVNAVLINERDVKDNVLELKLTDFASRHLRYTLLLYGGEGSEDERVNRVKAASNYFRGQFDKAEKANKSQVLYLPPLKAVKDSIIGTQISPCGLGEGFDLLGNNRNLGFAVGVFGVCN